MKIKDIYDMELANTNSIYLIREGNFYRAYEHSALLFTENVEPYHLLKRLYKVINAEMVYLGFPQSALPKLLKEKGLKIDGETSQFLVLRPFTVKQDFESWKASVQCNTKEEDERSLLMQERIRPRFEDNHPLHIYKIGMDCMVEIYKLTDNMKRGYKYSVGEELRKDVFQLGLITFRIAKDGHGAGFAEGCRKALRQMDVVKLRLRLLAELHQIKITAFSRINTQLEYLVKQLEKGQ